VSIVDKGLIVGSRDQRSMGEVGEGAVEVVTDRVELVHGKVRHRPGSSCILGWPATLGLLGRFRGPLVPSGRRGSGRTDLVHVGSMAFQVLVLRKSHSADFTNELLPIQMDINVPR